MRNRSSSFGNLLRSFYGSSHSSNHGEFDLDIPQSFVSRIQTVGIHQTYRHRSRSLLFGIHGNVLRSNERKNSMGRSILSTNSKRQRPTHSIDFEFHPICKSLKSHALDGFFQIGMQSGSVVIAAFSLPENIDEKMMIETLASIQVLQISQTRNASLSSRSSQVLFLTLR